MTVSEAACRGRRRDALSKYLAAGYAELAMCWYEKLKGMVFGECRQLLGIDGPHTAGPPDGGASLIRQCGLPMITVICARAGLARTVDPRNLDEWTHRSGRLFKHAPPQGRARRRDQQRRVA